MLGQIFSYADMSRISPDARGYSLISGIDQFFNQLGPRAGGVTDTEMFSFYLFNGIVSIRLTLSVFIDQYTYQPKILDPLGVI
ncbi:MAG: hypothetical protein A2W79_08400 [Pseudomonadales bacterium RIFCSPLOWO2_12_60_38]|nr:hypothetical protein H098_09625 [Pseudomonas fluorescens FH5]OHC33526.1 MAG: hypothetical protein A2W79_08400 [Pseudomonadales bacterium RIFCSPLOWO2_12_60_38]OHC40570.1 MAG: hypothetical protein A3G72_15625 [Pseudomonadales bacterium RIFCSPLOWO2_12_FULL_59_450]PTT11560.1 hypothetical protein DBR14_13145 [Pseudomonas sp. HMWF034]PVV70653.1 hypothetical protein DD985_14995 [Pseudomonas sp. HMWF011]